MFLLFVLKLLNCFVNRMKVILISYVRFTDVSSPLFENNIDNNWSADQGGDDVEWNHS